MHALPMHYTPCSKKGDRDTKLMAVTPLIVNRISNFFFTFRFFSQFAAKYLLKIPPRKLIAVINHKLQGTVVTYLSCGEIFNN